jgi:hypothetical protein
MLLHSAKFDLVPMSLWGERFGAFYYFNALLDTPAVSCPTCTSSLIADFPFESTEILAYNSVAVRGVQCRHTFSIAVIARSLSPNS